MSSPNRTKGNLYFALELLIDACLESQEKAREEGFLARSSKEWIKEWCTVRMMSSRQSGHTTAILRYCQNHEDKKFAIFGSHVQMAKHIQDQVRSKNIKNALVSSAKAPVRLDSIKGEDLNGIFFDCSFWLSQKDIDYVIETCLPTMAANKEGYFVAYVQ